MASLSPSTATALPASSVAFYPATVWWSPSIPGRSPLQVIGYRHVDVVLQRGGRQARDEGRGPACIASAPIVRRIRILGACVARIEHTTGCFNSKPRAYRQRAGRPGGLGFRPEP